MHAVHGVNNIKSSTSRSDLEDLTPIFGTAFEAKIRYQMIVAEAPLP